jgi:hypothetical protein
LVWELAVALKSEVMQMADGDIPAAPPEQRIELAAEAVRTMTQELADELRPRPGWMDYVSEITREAPLQSLAVAFLIGVFLARR